MERIAIIDLGSNSIRFLIKEISNNSTFKLIFKDKKTIRLAEGIDKDLNLTDLSMQKAIDCLKIYSNIISIYKVDKVFAIATAAVRNAKNKNIFLKQIKKETNLSLKVIDGKKEAFLGFLGVIHTINKENFLMFDLGGASIEISLIKNKTIVNSTSLPLGAVNLTKKFNLKKEITSKKIKALENYILKEFKSIKWLPKEQISLIGIGGTIRCLAKIHQKQINYPINKLHNYTFLSNSIPKILDIVISTPATERKNIPGLSSDRSDIILAGTMVIKTLLNKINSKTITVSTSGLREGIFFNYYYKTHNFKDKQKNNMLINSVLNYKKNILPDSFANSNNTSKLALLIFDKLTKLHKLSKKSRNLLHAASILHELGLRINYFNHVKHTNYIIMNSPIYGWSHIDQIKTSFISSFHEGFSGKTLKNSPYFSLLTEDDIKEIKILSLVLNIAKIINLSHPQSLKNIEFKISKTNLVLLIYNSNIEMIKNCFSLNDITGCFYRLFNKNLIIDSVKK